VHDCWSAAGIGPGSADQ